MMNNFNEDCTTTESKSHEETQTFETFGDMKDGIIGDVLGTKAAEIKQAVTADTKKSRVDEAKEFLEFYFGHVTGKHFGYLWLKRKDTKGSRTVSYPVTDAKARAKMAADAIKFSDDGFDVYFGVNLTDKAPKKGNRSVKVANEKNDAVVTVQVATVTDIDIEGGTHINGEKLKNGEPVIYPPTFDEAKKLLPFQASIVVCSGYGLHADLIYREPVTVTAENCNDLEKRNENYLDVIRRKAGKYKYAVDGVHDLPRVLRMPGTRNYKLGITAEAPICHVLEFNDVRFSTAELDEQIAALTPSQEKNSAPTIADTHPDFAHKAERGELSEEIQALIDDINATVTPEMLMAKGYLEQSVNGDFCCVWCGSGHGQGQSGALHYYADGANSHFTCFSTRQYSKEHGGDVVALIAHVDNLPTSGKEFFDTLKYIADKFHITYNPKIFEFEPPRKSSDADTTQTFIADCPLDLEIPYGFSFSRYGIKKLIPKKNGDGFSEIVVSRTPVIVTKRFVEKKSISVEYELAFKTVYENKWIRKTFDAATIGDARQFTTLINSGISAQNHKLLAVYFDDLINSPTNAQKIQSVTMHSQTGWTDETFTEFIYPSPDADYIVRRNGFDFHKELGTRGDADIWKKTFVEAMKQGGAVARIYSGFALAAPLVRPFNIANPQTHLHAESGGGKTALEKLTASIFGNPKEMIRTFEATPKNRQAVAAAYCDMPTFLDELGTLKGKKADEYLSQSIYAYSLGNQNQAQKQTGDTRPLVKFYGARLSTGERAILKNHDPRGNFKRLPQLSCWKLLPDKFAAKLHVISESNFGHFGRPWINFVTKHLKKICDQYQLFATAFTQSDKYEATLVKAIVAAAVAYQFFMICIGEQSDFDDAALDADIQKILEDMPTIKEISDDTRAIEALSSFVASHPKHFITEYEANGKLQEREAAASPTFGKRFKNGEVAFHPDQLEKILENELKFSDCEAIITALANQGNLITNTGRTRHRIRLDGELTRTVHFVAGILSDGYNDFTPPPFD